MCANKMITIFLVSVLLFVSTGQGQKFQLIGEAYRSHSPCPNFFLGMENLCCGRPPSLQNYWDGTLALNAVKDLPEARVTLKLTAPATITLDPEVGTVNSLGGAFNLAFFKKNSTFGQVRFYVQGEQGKPFPEVESLKLNGVDFCPSPRQWGLVFGGPANKASIGTGERNGDSAPTEQLCGRRQIAHQGLIINKWPTKEGDWPWHAALYLRDRSSAITYQCGGTLISSDTVLTAAHCIAEGTSFIIEERLVVRLGQFHRIRSTGHTQEFEVHKLIVHEDFDFVHLRNDIALLKLATQAMFTAYVQPACLWPLAEEDLSNVVGKVGTLIGWGSDENQKLSDYLAQGSMPVVSFSTCLTSKREFFGSFLSDRNFCAGFLNGTTACTGDSGGGLFFKKGDEYRIRGIVSLSRRDISSEVACDSSVYVLFTDVAKYLDWIQRSSKQ